MDQVSPNGLQTFRFSTASYRQRDRVAAWREVFGRTLLHIDIEPRSAEGFQANALVSCGSGLGILQASTSAAYFRRRFGCTPSDVRNMTRPPGSAEVWSPE